MKNGRATGSKKRLFLFGQENELGEKISFCEDEDKENKEGKKEFILEKDFQNANKNVKFRI